MTQVETMHMRRAIVEAAVRLFHEQSYAATGVQQIVAEANCTKGAFYHYWRSKEALLLEIHDTFLNYAINRGRAIVSAGHPPEKALRLLMLELMRQLDLYRPQMTILFQEAPYVRYESYPESKAKRDEYQRTVTAVLDEGIAAGVFRNDVQPTDVLSLGIMGMCVWSYQWFRPAEDLTSEQIGEQFARVVVDGLRCNGVAGHRSAGTAPAPRSEQ